eukprot:195789-Karenia_brevis.AAC.1
MPSRENVNETTEKKEATIEKTAIASRCTTNEEPVSQTRAESCASSGAMVRREDQRSNLPASSAAEAKSLQETCSDKRESKKEACRKVFKKNESRSSSE